MAQAENYLHTTHRTVAWFNKAFQADELELAPPFQRNPVWTDHQKAYLVDTILLGLPIPELYMQDFGDESGSERHIVVDGQQRIRAILDFIAGGYELVGDEVSVNWRGLAFEKLGADEKKNFFAYKFVVRILPPTDEEGLRRIFARLNRNTVALNDQELRNATYWGPFIKTIQSMADEDPFWSEAGLFSANDHRRMQDHEYISELVVAFLHGAQNKKEKLEQYYQLYEGQFEDSERVKKVFRNVTSELGQVLPALASTRWRKKSDFYTLFSVLASHEKELPFAAELRAQLSRRILEFGNRVDQLLRLEEGAWQEDSGEVVAYARGVSRAASDKANRVARYSALDQFLFGSSQRELIQAS